MAENTYTVGYSTNAKAKCKYGGCGKPIEKDDIRFAKSSASAFSDRPKNEYYHAKCMFLSFVRARKTTKKIESMSDIEGIDGIKPAEKDMIKKLLKEFKAGDMKDQVYKITRKRKAEGDEEDDKKKKKKTDKAKKDDSDEEEDIKPKKTRKVTKSSDDNKLKKSSKKQQPQDSDEDEEDDDDDDDDFSLILNGKSSVKKRVADSESEDKSEEEKPKSKAKAKNSKKSKLEAESVEEVKESASSDEEEENKNDKFLSGKIIALCGKLSLPREKMIELIEKNGGKYAKSITKDVTHVICAKADDKTQKLQKAKEAGKIIVTESFLKKGQ